ncbi:MAG: dehydrogenase [Rhodospirillales bacterium]|jgi:phosphoglycerate dehydrogenase-like enzyme|nr:dehydrogenase [Rhodospirillales bacterium]
MTKDKILRVGVTRDFVRTDGTVNFLPEAWHRLEGHPRIELHLLEDEAPTTLTRAHTSAFDVILMKRSPLPASAIGEPAPRLFLVSRNGVGFDHIDVPACTEAGIMVTITPDAVRRPVASAIMALILSLAHQVIPRDQMTRAGRWKERWNTPGIALTGRTLGVVGLGNIGRELLRVAAPWDMRLIGVEPFVPQEGFPDLDVELVDLDTVLAEADFVSLCCPYIPATHHLIGARELALMKPSAYLVNTARGEIIDEPALVQALSVGGIAGAGIDVFEKEPPATDNPLFGLDNVVLGSHNLAFNDESNDLGNIGAAEAILAVANGESPRHLINPEVLEHPRFK